ncbi:hypothetical protein JCM8547_006136 [Rhodosporidiobolus lusitaniae]
MKLYTPAMLRNIRSQCLRSTSTLCATLSTASSHSANRVKLVEVGPRDGLQNEKALLSTDLKVGLIERLVKAGMRDVEAGSFVHPKWMASTPEVLTSQILDRLRKTHPDLSLPVLVPNSKGLSSLLALQSSHPSSSPSLTTEIAVFVSASESFSKANLNTSISSSLAALESVFSSAREHSLRVRGYVSVVLGCPFEGKLEPEKPAEVAKTLLDMGAYEVSLGDTVGVGVPSGWERLLNECERGGVGVDKLAAHCHDTYGTAIANVLHCVSLGVRTIDSSIAALGGCPYSPGATGNVSTEDVLYALSLSGVSTTALPDLAPGEVPEDLLALVSQLGQEGKTARQKKFEELCEVGKWVSERLGRENGSGVGRAVEGKKRRAREKVEKEKGGKAKL